MERPVRGLPKAGRGGDGGCRVLEAPHKFTTTSLHFGICFALGPEMVEQKNIFCLFRRGQGLKNENGSWQVASHTDVEKILYSQGFFSAIRFWG